MKTEDLIIVCCQVLLCWAEGAAVGFCTIKPRGAFLPGSCFMQTYNIDIVDSVFIRKSHRRKGNGMKLLETLVKTYR